MIRAKKAEKLKPVLTGKSPKKMNMMKIPNKNLSRLPDQIFWMKRDRKKSEAALKDKFLSFMKQDENLRFRKI